MRIARGVGEGMGIAVRMGVGMSVFQSINKLLSVLKKIRPANYLRFRFIHLDFGVQFENHHSDLWVIA